MHNQNLCFHLILINCQSHFKESLINQFLPIIIHLDINNEIFSQFLHIKMEDYEL
jgi:hypothetical protein